MVIATVFSRIISLFLSLSSSVLLAVGPGSGVGHSAGAGSPFNDYMAGVTIYVLIVGFLVSSLLIGAFLILNLGLMSKRPEDRIGERNPSDLGILKQVHWPESPYEKNILPAEDEEEEQTQEELKRSA